MPTGFPLGPFYIHYYGIIIMLGALAGAWLASREAVRHGENSDRVWDILTWIVIGGVIGARTWHILTPPQSMVDQGMTTEYYFTHPLDAIAVWKGGLGLPGAVIGGALAIFLFTRYYKLSFPTWLDIVAPALALGQAIGRWGNFFNQELYGSPSNLPWAIAIDSLHRLPAFQDIERYHPLFLYESIYNLLNVFFLLWISCRCEKSLKSGDLFLIYLVTYPTARFFLEFLRLDPAHVAGLNVNQTLMAVTAIASALALFLRHRNSGEPVAGEISDTPLPPAQAFEEAHQAEESDID
jgi:phosphatidylglycerol---prolipoprotein diacylglyceryl transferase